MEKVIAHALISYSANLVVVIMRKADTKLFDNERKKLFRFGVLDCVEIAL